MRKLTSLPFPPYVVLAKVPIRHAVPTDMSYVLNSWCRSSHSCLESSYHWSKWGRPPAYSVYKVLFDDVQHRIMRRADVLIATNDDDTDQILGFAIIEPSTSTHPPILHYVQTKQELWRTGIAESLLAHAGITRETACIYTFTSPVLSLINVPPKWSNIPHWLGL